MLQTQTRRTGHGGQNGSKQCLTTLADNSLLSFMVSHWRIHCLLTVASEFTHYLVFTLLLVQDSTNTRCQNALFSSDVIYGTPALGAPPWELEFEPSFHYFPINACMNLLLLTALHSVAKFFLVHSAVSKPHQWLQGERDSISACFCSIHCIMDTDYRALLWNTPQDIYACLVILLWDYEAGEWSYWYNDH